MKTLVAICAFAIALTGCSWFSSNVTPVVDHAIDCAKAEADAATAGKSPIQIGLDVIDQVGAALAASGGNVTAAVEAVLSALFAQYGMPIVACALHETPAPKAAARAASPSGFGAVIGHYGWTYK